MPLNLASFYPIRDEGVQILPEDWSSGWQAAPAGTPASAAPGHR